MPAPRPKTTELEGGLSIRAIAGQWRSALDETMHAWRHLVLFQVWFVLIASAILGSAAGWLLDRLVRTTGSAAITNFDLAAFFLSAPGLTFLAVLIGTWGALFLAERCGVLLLVAHPGQATGAIGTLAQLARRLPQLISLSWWYAAILAGTLLPFALIAVAIAKILLGAHDINYYLYHQPSEWWLAVACGVALALAYGATALFLWFRFVFSLQLMLFHGQTPRTSLRQSWLMTKGRVLRLAALLGGWWLIVAFAAALASTLVGLGASAALAAAEAHIGTSLAVILAAALVIWLIGIAGHILSMSGEVILAQRLYLACGGTIPTATEGVTARSKRYPAWALSGMLCAALLLVVATIAWRIDSSVREDDFTITAHRAGAAKAPENTLAALKQAIADGADIAEIDVQSTRDGELVILHDGDLARLAGDPRSVAELTLKELRQLDIGRWHDSAFAGERVATLGEMIAVSRGQIRLNVELKYNREDPTLAAKVIQLLRNEGILDECVITSLEHSAVREAKWLAPEVQVGLIVTKSIGDPAETDADFLSLNQDAVSARLLQRAHSRGKAVHVWTVNDRPSMERMVEMGVDSLITDHPATASELRVARAALSAPEKLVLRLRWTLLGH